MTLTESRPVLRNHDGIVEQAPLRRPLEGRHSIGELLDPLHD